MVYQKRRLANANTFLKSDSLIKGVGRGWSWQESGHSGSYAGGCHNVIAEEIHV